MSFDSWHDFFYMGGHYLYVWLSYGIGLGGVVMLLARPVLARRRLLAQLRQQARHTSQQEIADDASHSA